jgi:hypothetical protein
MVGGQLAKLLDLMSFRIVKGIVIGPTAAGNYAVTTLPDADGNTSSISLSPEEIVISCAIYGPAITSGGSPTFDIGSAATSGAGISVSFLAAPATMAQLVVGRSGTALSPAAVSTNEYVSVTTASATVTAGDIYVTLLVINAKHPQ